MVRARSSPVEDELSFPVHDVQVALGNRDRKQPPADHFQPLRRDDDPDDLVPRVADRHRERYGQRLIAELRIHLGHVRPPLPAHPLVPVAVGEAPAQRLRGFGVDRPDDPGWIGQEGPVDVGESLADLAEVNERRPAVLQLHGLAEGEVPGHVAPRLYRSVGHDLRQVVIHECKTQRSNVGQCGERESAQQKQRSRRELLPGR